MTDQLPDDEEESRSLPLPPDIDGPDTHFEEFEEVSGQPRAPL